MKTIFTLLLECFFAYSMAQSGNIQIGKKDFIRIQSSDNLTIYFSSCENCDDYLFASKSLVRYDSVSNIDYLRSYNYADGSNFDCQDSIDQSTMSEINTLLLKKNTFHNKVSILFGMKDKDNAFIGILFLFKKNRFKKFLDKANSPIKKTYAGERILIWKYEYHKYAEEFILARTGGYGLSLIPVSRSYLKCRIK